MIEQSSALLNHACAGYVGILSTHVHTQCARCWCSTGLDARTSLPHVRSLHVSAVDCAAISCKRAIRNPDVWYHDGDHAVLMRSTLGCHDVRFDPLQPRMRPI